MQCLFYLRNRKGGGIPSTLSHGPRVPAIVNGPPPAILTRTPASTSAPFITSTKSPNITQPMYPFPRVPLHPRVSITFLVRQILSRLFFFFFLHFPQLFYFVGRTRQDTNVLTITISYHHGAQGITLGTSILTLCFSLGLLGFGPRVRERIIVYGVDSIQRDPRQVPRSEGAAFIAHTYVYSPKRL